MTDQFTVGVTGAAGYIGSRVLYELQDAHPEWNVVAIDNFYLGDVREVGDVQIQHLDVRDRRGLEEAFADVDVVFHLAAISGVDDCDENRDRSYEVNVQGTNNVAYFCQQHGAGLVFPASMAIFGDPDSFPITTDLPRDPLNWYGRTKVLGERAIEGFADGAFPAHVFVKSNLYGDHWIGGERITKGTVINFVVGRALAEEPLTVYEPGTQSRNFIHVVDVARAYVRSAERMHEQLQEGHTGVETYPLASDQDPSVSEIAELVKQSATEHGLETSIELVENPRSAETMVEEFSVDTSRTHEELGWYPEHDVAVSINQLISENVDPDRQEPRASTAGSSAND